VWDVLKTKTLVRKLIETVSCGGNLLINVGATADGLINPIYEDRLLEFGKWLDVNGEGIYGTTTWTTANDTLAPGVW
jgi:alpha-L-fucosidase